jgi:hypothetical protein
LVRQERQGKNGINEIGYLGSSGKGGSVKTVLNSCVMTIVLLVFLLLSGCGKTVHESHVTSDPPGAVVFLNNKIVGETPCDLTLHQRQGDYNIYTFRAVKDDYMPARKAYKEELYYQTVDDVIPESVHFDLRKRETYQIYITSNPTEAVILLNGEVIGEAPFNAMIQEPIEDYYVFTFVAKKDGFGQVKKELREFAPRKSGKDVKLPETMHFDFEN